MKLCVHVGIVAANARNTMLPGAAPEIFLCTISIQWENRGQVELGTISTHWANHSEVDYGLKNRTSKTNLHHVLSLSVLIEPRFEPVLLDLWLDLWMLVSEASSPNTTYLAEFYSASSFTALEV